MTRDSRLGATGLFVRGLAAGAGPAAVIAVIVLCASFVAAAAPRALTALDTAAFEGSVAALAPVQRDLVAIATGVPAMEHQAATVDEAFVGMVSALNRIRSSFGHPLESVVGDAEFAMTTGVKDALAAEPGRDAPITRLGLAADPRSAERLRIVEGAAPEPTLDRQVTGFMASIPTAEALRWRVGEERVVASAMGMPWRLQLTGTFEAVDPGDPYWAQVSSVLQPFLFDDGNSTPVNTGTGFVHPLDTALAAGIMASPSTRVWYPVGDVSSAAAEAGALAQQLRAATTGPRSLDVELALGSITALTFSSRLTNVIEAVLASAQSTVSLLAMVAAGPVGVLLAVLALGSRIVIQRRKTALALLSARGASPWALRSLGAVEGLVIGIPAAALGVAAAVIVLPGPTLPAQVALSAIVGLAPAALLAAAFPSAGSSPARSRLGVAVRPRFAWVAEAAVIGLAVLSVVLLTRRGLGGGGVGFDPLLAATPLLLAVAAVVVVLRGYPVPLRAIEGALRRTRGLTGFLGAARAVREPAGGLAAVLALVVGVSVAVFSGVMATTLDRGVDAAARASVGADLQAAGPIFAPDQLDEVRALPGVASVAGLDDAGRASITVDRVRGTVALIVADVAELRGLRPGMDLPDALSAVAGGSIPMLVSDDLAAELEADAALLLGGEPAEVVATADRGDGVVAQSRWVLIDAAHTEDVTNSRYLPRILLIDLAGDADLDAVADAVAEIGGSTTTTREPAEAARDIRAAPAVSGLQTALVLAMALVAVLAAIAVIMASVVGARARGRMLALLRILGLSRREAADLAAWELAPVAITATIVGTALGLALPWLVVAGLDLRPFTGGSAQPAVAVDLLGVLGLVGLFAAVVVAAVLAGLVIGQRTDAAAALRMGEEG